MLLRLLSVIGICTSFAVGINRVVETSSYSYQPILSYSFTNSRVNNLYGNHDTLTCNFYPYYFNDDNELVLGGATFDSSLAISNFNSKDSMIEYACSSAPLYNGFQYDLVLCIFTYLNSTDTICNNAVIPVFSDKYCNYLLSYNFDTNNTNSVYNSRLSFGLPSQIVTFTNYPRASFYSYVYFNNNDLFRYNFTTGFYYITYTISNSNPLEEQYSLFFYFPLLSIGSNDPQYINAYNEGYNAGYNSGYDYGYGDGYTGGRSVGLGEGYQNGYDEGYHLGYIDGHNDGINEATPLQLNFLTLLGAIADTPVYMIRSLFSFEFFGISALAVFMTLLTAVVVIYFVRKLL